MMMTATTTTTTTTTTPVVVVAIVVMVMMVTASHKICTNIPCPAGLCLLHVYRAAVHEAVHKMQGKRNEIAAIRSITDIISYSFFAQQYNNVMCSYNRIKCMLVTCTFSPPPPPSSPPPCQPVPVCPAAEATSARQPRRAAGRVSVPCQYIGTYMHVKLEGGIESWHIFHNWIQLVVRLSAALSVAGLKFKSFLFASFDRCNRRRRRRLLLFRIVHIDRVAVGWLVGWRLACLLVGSVIVVVVVVVAWSSYSQCWYLTIRIRHINNEPTTDSAAAAPSALEILMVIVKWI